MGKVLNVATNVATGGMLGVRNGGLSGGLIGGAIDRATTGGKIERGLRDVGNTVADIALGEKTPGTPDEVIDLASKQGRALQEQALGMYGQELGRDTSQIAAAQTAQQEMQARQNVADQETRARQMVAQRGLGNTAMGMNAILGQQANLGKDIGNIRAQAPGLAQQMRQQQLGFGSQGINQILNEQGQSKVLKLGQQAQGRSGGLLGMALPIAGQVLGGMAGAGAFGKG